MPNRPEPRSFHPVRRGPRRKDLREKQPRRSPLTVKRVGTSLTARTARDPVEAGLVQSLARSGRPHRQYVPVPRSLGKRVEFLKQGPPRLRLLAASSNADHPGEKSELHTAKMGPEARY
jgi:hypothetical protein